MKPLAGSLFILFICLPLAAGDADSKQAAKAQGAGDDQAPSPKPTTKGLQGTPTPSWSSSSAARKR